LQTAAVRPGYGGRNDTFVEIGQFEGDDIVFDFPAHAEARASDLLAQRVARHASVDG
jgi:hypothetical protein